MDKRHFLTVVFLVFVLAVVIVGFVSSERKIQADLVLDKEREVRTKINSEKNIAQCRKLGGSIVLDYHMIMKRCIVR